MRELVPIEIENCKFEVGAHKFCVEPGLFKPPSGLETFFII
jgi:hypothetical protein